MEKFNKQHQRNIQLMFEEKTGTDLNPAHRVRQRKNWKPVYAAVLMIAVIATLVSCAPIIFSPLRGDALALVGEYEGEGIVAVTVTNSSDKTLHLQEKVKLVSWHTGKVQSPTGQVHFDGNTEIPPHTSQTIRIDLTDAYDVDGLEQEVNPKYYLLLTNQDYFFGQDWMCSFSFPGAYVTEPAETEENIHAACSVDPEILENMEPQLRYYFQDSYQDEAPALNQANFIYQDKVREWLLRQKGYLVHPVDPWLKLENAVFDEAIPEKWRECQIINEYSAIDGFGRVVGSSFGGAGSDYVLKLSALVPGRLDYYNTGIYMPLVYLVTYLKDDTQNSENHTFLYGRLLTMAEMDTYRVFENEKYVVYEVTELFYRDLDGYINDFLTIRDDAYVDETVRQRLHAIYDFYRNRDTLPEQFAYFDTPNGAAPMVPPAP